jgi:hypothetical protein
MRFLTWRNRSPDLPDLLTESAHRYGITIENVGWGQRMVRLVSKLDWLQQALSTFDKRDVVVCTDSYDVLYAAGEREIMEAFLALECSIVFAAERWYSHQDKRLKQVFDRLPIVSPYRYINSGTVAGYAGELLDMLTVISGVRWRHPFRGNDQWFVGKYFCENPGHIRLDYNCDLFWCTGGEWDDVEHLAEVVNGRLKHRITGTYPSIVHVPWRERYSAVREDLARRLGAANQAR